MDFYSNVLLWILFSKVICGFSFGIVSQIFSPRSFRGFLRKVSFVDFLSNFLLRIFFEYSFANFLLRNFLSRASLKAIKALIPFSIFSQRRFLLGFFLSKVHGFYFEYSFSEFLSNNLSSFADFLSKILLWIFLRSMKAFIPFSFFSQRPKNIRNKIRERIFEIKSVNLRGFSFEYFKRNFLRKCFTDFFSR